MFKVVLSEKDIIQACRDYVLNKYYLNADTVMIKKEGLKEITIELRDLWHY